MEGQLQQAAGRDGQHCLRAPGHAHVRLQQRKSVPLLLPPLGPCIPPPPPPCPPLVVLPRRVFGEATAVKVVGPCGGAVASHHGGWRGGRTRGIKDAAVGLVCGRAGRGSARRAERLADVAVLAHMQPHRSCTAGRPAQRSPPAQHESYEAGGQRAQFWLMGGQELRAGRAGEVRLSLMQLACCPCWAGACGALESRPTCLTRPGYPCWRSRCRSFAAGTSRTCCPPRTCCGRRCGRARLVSRAAQAAACTPRGCPPCYAGSAGPCRPPPTCLGCRWRPCCRSCGVGGSGREVKLSSSASLVKSGAAPQPLAMTRTRRRARRRRAGSWAGRRCPSGSAPTSLQVAGQAGACACRGAGQRLGKPGRVQDRRAAGSASRLPAQHE